MISPNIRVTQFLLDFELREMGSVYTQGGLYTSIYGTLYTSALDAMK